MVCRVVTVLHNNFFRSNSSICSFISVPTVTTLFRFLLVLTKTNARAFHVASHFWFSLYHAAASVFQKARLLSHACTKTYSASFSVKMQMSYSRILGQLRSSTNFCFQINPILLCHVYPKQYIKLLAMPWTCARHFCIFANIIFHAWNALASISIVFLQDWFLFLSLKIQISKNLQDFSHRGPIAIT